MRKKFYAIAYFIIFAFLVNTNVAAQANTIQKEKWHWVMRCNKIPVPAMCK